MFNEYEKYEKLIENLFEEFGRGVHQLRGVDGKFRKGPKLTRADTYIYTLKPDRERLTNYKSILGTTNLGVYKIAESIRDEVVPRVKKIKEYKSYLQKLLDEIKRGERKVEDAERRLDDLANHRSIEYKLDKLNAPLSGFLIDARKRKYENVKKWYTEFKNVIERGGYKSKLEEKIRELEKYLSDYEEVLALLPKTTSVRWQKLKHAFRYHLQKLRKYWIGRKEKKYQPLAQVSSSAEREVEILPSPQVERVAERSRAPSFWEKLKRYFSQSTTPPSTPEERAKESQSFWRKLRYYLLEYPLYEKWNCGLYKVVTK